MAILLHRLFELWRPLKTLPQAAARCFSGWRCWIGVCGRNTFIASAV